MKKTILTLTIALLALNFSRAQEIDIQHESAFAQKPIPVALSGFTGEGAEVLKFDLYVQGFSFVAPDAAQYLISGSDAGNVTGSVTDKFAKRVVLSRTYNGASTRRQAHAFADDVVQAIQNRKGVGQTKIAYKSQGASGPGVVLLGLPVLASRGPRCLGPVEVHQDRIAVLALDGIVVALPVTRDHDLVAVVGLQFCVVVASHDDLSGTDE